MKYFADNDKLSFMKIIRCLIRGRVECGIMEGTHIQSISSIPFPNYRKTSRNYEPDEVKLLPPCLPSKIVAMALNYRSHALEINIEPVGILRNRVIK